MSLSSEEIETLQSIMDKNRQNAPDSTSLPDLAEVTDDSLAVVRGTHTGRGRRYHAYADGEPACGTETKTRIQVRDIEEARAWFGPCKRCYPEGDPGASEQEREVSDASE